MTDELIYPKKEPEKYIPKLLKIGLKIETSEYISWKVEKEHYDRFNSISKEERQNILDMFRKGGITIGEIAKKTNINNLIVGDVIYLNISHIKTLNIDSI